MSRLFFSAITINVQSAIRIGIFVLIAALSGGNSSTVLAQGYYGYSSPAYQYYSQPGRYPQSYPDYYNSQYPDYPQQRPGLPSTESKATVKNPPVEIWLERRMGRIGDYWFEALGGSSKHPTPKGTFTVKAKHEDFYSRKYKAEMPHSVFFTEQCAIHAGSLRVKSHGCIHVSDEAARAIFNYAKTGKTKVKVYR